MSFKTISVVGLGYIGLPTAAMLASKATRVVGVDVDSHVVETINQGKIHIVEPGLDEMVRKAVDRGFLEATISPQPAEAFIIAVPTPFLPGTREGSTPKPDLSYIKSAAKSVAGVLKKGDIIILESTSPVGTTEQLSEWLAEERGDLSFPQSHEEDSDIRIAYCPERVLPGKVMEELISNDRVIGGMTEKCSQAAIEVYRAFVEGDCIVTNARIAEMTKLTENAFRDLNVAFANELSMICDELRVDVWELIRLANLHPRVDILQPGPGVGGHCIPVDPWFIVDKTPEHAKLIRTAREVNNAKPDWVINKVKMAVTEYLEANPNKRDSDVVIGCYGLTFKADIDDLRESPAAEIARRIAIEHPGKVLAVEPNIETLPANLEGYLELVNFAVANQSVSIRVLLVDHQEFKGQRIAGSSKPPLTIDTRGVV
jgi:UDP-N-acetyl-D-mannosaminuronic acid dehydrogenase